MSGDVDPTMAALGLEAKQPLPIEEQRKQRVEEQRRQRVVLTADLVGYSELIFKDASQGIGSLVETRDLLARAIIRHRGQVVSTPGDFILAVFLDAVDAAAAAIEGQSGLLDRNRGLSPKEAVAWRIGVAYGDIFEIGDDIYGHAVNVAARIQSLGRPGDVLITGLVEEKLRTQVEFPTESLGPHRLKNIAEPVSVYRLRWPGLEQAVQLVEHFVPAELLQRLAKPLLRIEAFEVFERSERKALIARGIEEEIHIVLSRLSHSISVLDRDAPDGRPKPDYVLRGNMQSAGRHLRLMARLVSVATGATLWAERYECDLTGEFDVQDDIAREIVVALQLALTEGEQARHWRQGTRSGIAWELFQRGRDAESRYTRQGHHLARSHYEEAVRLDPSYMSALVALGFCHVDEVRLGWSDDDQKSLKEAEAVLDHAMGVDPNHPEVLALTAFVRQMQGRSDEALSTMDRAVRAGRRNSEIVGYQGALLWMRGDFAAANQAYQRALTLTSHAKPWIASNLGLSYLVTGKVVEAERIYRSVIENHPDYGRAWIGLAVVLVRRNRMTEARDAAARVLELDAEFTVSAWGRSRPLGDPALFAEFLSDLKAAGLPP